MKTANRTAVDGAAAADLYQTYGVPPEVFETMAAENNLAFDWDAYNRAMEEHGRLRPLRFGSFGGPGGPGGPVACQYLSALSDIVSLLMALPHLELVIHDIS